MPNNIAFFAVHADDLSRARRFYESVFGWQIRPWGPPDFFVIRTGSDDDPGIEGALEKRTTPVTGTSMTGYECTIGVACIDDTLAAVERHGGTIVMQKAVIKGVGTLIKFHDTEGNLVCAMQYDKHAE